MKRSKFLPKTKQTTVQITDTRMNGLRYKAFQEGDCYTSITLDKVLSRAGILQLSDDDLERLVEKKVKEEAIIAE